MMKFSHITLLAAAFAPAALAADFEPVAPSGLKAETNGSIVNLEWQWGNAGDLTLSEGFESGEFPENTWTVKAGNTYSPESNWFVFDFTDMDQHLSHGGDKAAILMIGDGDYDDPTSFHQDEWLIARPGVGAVYLDFWYYIYPELLEVGAYPDFPDHYYVMISRDNGKTWNELWDARWDMGNVDDVQQASLFLGNPTDENTLVAFRGYSAEEESLYYLWVVDDVEFRKATAEPASVSLKASASRPAISKSDLRGMRLNRKFTPAAGARKAARIGEDEWLNGGNITYRVYADGEMVADYLKTRHFTDITTKQPGDHVYEVMAWSEALNKEYPSAKITVATEADRFDPARNINAEWTDDGNGKYSISVSWEAPEVEQGPAYYEVFVNDKSIGRCDAGDELSMGQSGLYKGAYHFKVVACYSLPEGQSEPICASVFPGTLATPMELKVSESGNGHLLEWKAPSADCSYTIYRGDSKIADGVKECTYTHVDAPAGRYTYSVHAVYADGMSLPASCEVVKGEERVLSLPLDERFNNGHLPEGWTVSMIDPYDRVKDMYAWRFDNWFDMTLKGENAFEGGFACISGVAGGMNRLESYITTPWLHLPDGQSVLLFESYFNEDKPGPSGEAGYILEYTLGDDDWITMADLREMKNGLIQLPLDNYAGKDIRFRWGFLGRQSGEAAIDNVKVYEGPMGGVESIEAASDAATEWFTLQGLRVDRPSKGIYIARKGSEIRKVVVR